MESAALSTTDQPQADNGNSPFSALPAETLRQLQMLARQEIEQKRLEKRWAKALGLFFGIAVAAFLAALLLWNGLRH